MPKVKKSSYPKSIETYKNDPQFYEELAILKAQEKISELMENSNTTRTKLATLLNQSKAHVTELLSDGRNLTLRSFARVCFHLNAEIDFQTYLIGTKHSAKKLTSGSNFNITYKVMEIENLLSSISIHLDDKIKDNLKKKSTSTTTYNNIKDTYKKDVHQFNNSHYKVA